MDVEVAPNGVTRSTLEVRDAPAPFNKSTADVILRSSDLCDFRVRRAILAEASSVFEGMFALPQPPHTDSSVYGPSAGGDEHRDGLPVLAMQEDSRTLDLLLRICYPVVSPSFDSLEALSPVLAAAVKYVVDGAIATIRVDLRRLAKLDPLRVYCLSMHYGFLEEAEEAAKASLAFPAQPLFARAAQFPELELVNGKILIYLINYRQACVDTLSVLTHSLPFLDDDDWVWFTCEEDQYVCPSSDSLIYLGNGVHPRAATWWLVYMTSVREILWSQPCGSAIRDATQPFEAALNRARACTHCGGFAREQMDQFIEDLIAFVDERVSAVRQTRTSQWMNSIAELRPCFRYDSPTTLPPTRKPRCWQIGISSTSVQLPLRRHCI